jgi:hypothetical protein
VTISPSVLSASLKQDLSEQGLPCEGEFWPGMTIKEAAAVSLSNALIKNGSMTQQKRLIKQLLTSSCRATSFAKNGLYPVNLTGELKSSLTALSRPSTAFGSGNDACLPPLELHEVMVSSMTYATYSIMLV